jgi:hypothetical protein
MSAVPNCRRTQASRPHATGVSSGADGPLGRTWSRAEPIRPVARLRMVRGTAINSAMGFGLIRPGGRVVELCNVANGVAMD